MTGVSTFDPSAYGPVFETLLAVDRLRALDGGSPEARHREQLDLLTIDTAFAHTTVTDAEYARCCLAGVWLLCDYLDESHTISQGIDSSSGSFWHGIMHRREGDFSNSKYWFRRVGDHPVFEKLGSATDAGHWDPFAFVDACQSAIRDGGTDADRCRELQQLEWELLFDDCFRRAVSGER